MRASYQVAREVILNTVNANALVGGAGGCGIGAVFGFAGSIFGSSEPQLEGMITGTGKAVGVVSAIVAPTMTYQMSEYAPRGNITVPRKVTIAATASNIPIGFVTGMGATVLCGNIGYRFLEEAEDILLDE